MSASTNESSAKRSLDITSLLSAIMVGGIFLVGVVQGAVSAFVPDPGLRGVIFAALVALVALAAIIFLRRFAPVEIVTNFLLVTIFAFLPLVPVLFFAANDRILLIKIGGVILLSIIPGWLYLQFISAKGRTLQEEYVINLFRLHIDDYRNLPEPPKTSPFHELWEKSQIQTDHGVEPATTDPAASNLYLRKFEGVYGGGPSGSSRESLTPVLLTTLLLASGWVAVLQPDAMANLQLPFAVGTGGLPPFPADALRFGFLGAYFFVFQMLVRRYFQDDLKTSAYINSALRIIAVSLLVIAVDASGFLKPEQELVAAFLFGIFPQVALHALSVVATAPLRGLVPSLRTDYPLSDLDGLNVWYESRLLEEGIEDMENLATANLVDVMLRTRVPVDRLVDWVDQAHLFLHVRKDDGIPASSAGTARPSSREILRQLGIRTATDLQDACWLPERTDDIFNRTRNETARLLRKALNRPGTDGLPNTVDTILMSLDNEPNLYHVQKWRRLKALLKTPTRGTATDADDFDEADEPVS